MVLYISHDLAAHEKILICFFFKISSYPVKKKRKKLHYLFPGLWPCIPSNLLLSCCNMEHANKESLEHDPLGRGSNQHQHQLA